MRLFPSFELRKPVVEEDLEKGKEFMVFYSDYRVEFEQRIEVKDGGESKCRRDDFDSGVLGNRGCRGQRLHVQTGIFVRNLADKISTLSADNGSDTD